VQGVGEDEWRTIWSHPISLAPVTKRRSICVKISGHSEPKCLIVGSVMFLSADKQQVTGTAADWPTKKKK